MEAIRLLVAWEHRADGVEVAAQQLVLALGRARATLGLTGAFSAVDRVTGERLPCESQTEAARAVGLGFYPIEDPPPLAPQFYQQHFTLGSLRRWRARVTLVCGLGTEVFGLATLNRFDLLVRDEVALPAVQKLLIELAGVFRAVSGFAASENLPAAAYAADGSPAVGRLTYLSSFFGPPPRLDAPAQASFLDGKGTLIEAFPEALRPLDQKHRQRLRALETALRTSGMLRPYSASAKPSSIALPAPEPESTPSRRSPVPEAPLAASAAGPTGVAVNHATPASAGPGRVATMALDVHAPAAAPLPFRPEGSGSALDNAIAHANAVHGPAPMRAASGATVELGTAAAWPAAHQAVPPSLPHAQAQCQPPASGVSVPIFTLEQYASLCVEIALSPHRVEQTLVRYQLTAAARTALDAQWRARFAADPALRRAFAQAFAAYKTMVTDAARRA